MNNPMLICTIDHDMKHPKSEPMNPPYLANWLAFNQKERIVLVEVESKDSQGLERFKTDYEGHYEIKDTHSLENPLDWMILVGEPSGAIQPDDELKLIKHLTEMNNIQEETTEVKLLSE